MSCVDENIVADYLNQRLSPDQVDEVEGHVDGCEECRLLLVHLGRAFPEPPTVKDDPAGSIAQIPPLVGQRLGQYVLLEWIGAGGMGVVYSAYDTELDRKVAIKLDRERPLGRVDDGGARSPHPRSQGAGSISPQRRPCLPGRRDRGASLPRDGVRRRRYAPSLAPRKATILAGHPGRVHRGGARARGRPRRKLDPPRLQACQRARGCGRLGAGERLVWRDRCRDSTPRRPSHDLRSTVLVSGLGPVVLGVGAEDDAAHERECRRRDAGLHGTRAVPRRGQREERPVRLLRRSV